MVNISYGFDSPGFVANLNIYNAKRRKVRSLLKSELIGMEGVCSWDGIDDSRKKAPVGIYIITLEVFNLHGGIKQFKNICVLASKL